MTSAQIRAGAVLAGAVVVALALWLVLANRTDDRTANEAGPSGVQQTSVENSAAVAPVRLSQNGLIDAARTQGTPLYWVGPRTHTGYEYSATSDGRWYVRYLPPRVRAGDPRPNFLTVGTYELPNPMAALRNAGRQPGGETVHIAGGAVAFMNRSKPTSAFIVGPGWKDQVEVYDPTPGRAMTLVLAGDVKPVR